MRRDVSDKEFLDAFFSEEMTVEAMQELDKRLQEPDFRTYYNQRLDEQYQKPIGKKLLDYLPMFIMIALTVVGIYLIFAKIF